MNSPASSAASHWSRRELLKSAGLAGLGLLGGWVPGRAASPALPPGLPPPRNRFPRMTHEYLVARVTEIERAAARQRAAVTTRAAAEAYVADVRARVRESFGPLPGKTELKPRVTRTTTRDGYRIEHVLFESRPDFLVTGNLYIPDGLTGRAPAILGECGHQAVGKADPRYQAFAQALARQGCVVLVTDPLGQGERSLYVNGAGEPAVRLGTRQHFAAGDQQVPTGEFLGTWRAWDGIRAIDYLLTRPEVDPARLGVTGHSGGGTLTTWLCGLEPRLAMAAPACFVTTFRHNLENEVSADPEQYPPRALALGLDLADFLVPLAPHPLLVLGAEKDFFDVRGLEESAGRLQRLYGLLGAPAEFRSHVGGGYHDYSPENQAEMVAWFNRAARLAARPAAEPRIEPPEALWCAPGGQVAALGSRPVFSFTRERARALARDRRPPGPALPDLVRRHLKLPAAAGGEPAYRILRAHAEPGYPVANFATYAVETEPGIQAIVTRLHREDSGAELESRPPRGAPRAILYVAHRSADRELRDEPWLRELLAAEPAAAFYVCDVRGIGDSEPAVGNLPATGPDTGDSFHAAYGLMLDYPVAGQRTHDLLRVLDWLQAAGHREVHLCARGWGAVPATFAALLSPLVVQVSLKRALTSYAAVTETERPQCPLALLLPGVLRDFDLPDCYAALAAKRLALTEPWEPTADLA